MAFHDYGELKLAVEGLCTIQLKWEALGRSDIVWGRSALLADCILREDGTFQYSFSPLVVQELIQPKRYRRLNLELMLGFQSAYALKIYESAWNFFDAKKRWGRTPGMTRDQLREWLNVPEGSYKVHRDFFKNCVLAPLREVNARGELLVSFHNNAGKPRVRQHWFEARFDPQSRLPFPTAVMPEDSEPEEPAATVAAPTEPMNEAEFQKAAEAFRDIKEAVRRAPQVAPSSPRRRKQESTP